MEQRSSGKTGQANLAGRRKTGCILVSYKEKIDAIYLQYNAVRRISGRGFHPAGSGPELVPSFFGLVSSFWFGLLSD
jgi:hypothetical protein